MSRNMKTSILKKGALLCALLLLLTGNVQATIHIVTNVGTGVYATDEATPGTTHYVSLQMADGDTMMFASELANETILCLYVVPPAGGRYTIIGNGVTFAGESDLNIGANAAVAKTFVLENLRFKDQSIVVAATDSVIVRNCVFLNTSATVKDVGHDATAGLFEGCAFIGTQKPFRVGVGISYGSATTDEFVSCTFYTADTYISNNTGNLINVANTCQSNIKLTNCVLMDEKATSSRPSIRVPTSSVNSTIISNGHNVVKGWIKRQASSGVWPAGDTDWTKQSTDEYIAPTDASIKPLTLVDEIPKVTFAGGNGKAYKHLPASTAIEGVHFPEKDLLGATIDYTKATHSGAYQAVYLADGESEPTEAAPVEDITLSLLADGIIYTDTTYNLTASVLPNGTEQKITSWTTDNTAVVVTPVGGSDNTATLQATGLAAETTVKLTLTAAGNGADGNAFSKDFSLTVKPYVHVTSVTVDKVNDVPFVISFTRRLAADVLPTDANNPTLLWTSSAPAVVELLQTTGSVVEVKGLSLGDATITATSEDGSIVSTYNIEVVKANYTEGVFFVNEDWFGHTNSTVNYLYPNGEWDYRAYKTINAPEGLGITTQHGSIYGGKFYFISKQSPRLAIADAVTMEFEKAFGRYGAEGSTGDGRAFLGVNDSIGYVSTSNGIYIIDTKNQLLKEQQVTGSEGNHDAGDGIANGGGGIYTGQTGTMQRVGDRVFAVHQTNGILVINAHTHQLETALKTDDDTEVFNSLALSKDGNLWTNVTTSNGIFRRLLRIDPWTLEVTQVSLPEGSLPPRYTYWGAWRYDNIIPDRQRNILYWTGGNSNSLNAFGVQLILRYDIETNKVDTVLNLADYDDGDWVPYETSYGVHPVTGEIYTSLYRANTSQTYRSIKFDPNDPDKGITTYPMEDHYWFPAMPVFPDNHLPEFVADAPITDVIIAAEKRISLNDKVTDADNLEVAIVKSIAGIGNPALIDARIWRDSLVITPRKTIAAGQPSESTTLTLKFNSNGHVITKTLPVTVTAGTTPPEEPPTDEVNPFELTQQTLALYPGQTAQLALTAPQHFSPTWRSTATAVATVTATGLVTTHAPGTALIIARDAATQKADTCRLTVTALPSGGTTTDTLRLSTSTLHLIQGERAALQVTVTPGLTGQTPQWSTANRNVADVTSSGTVIGIAPGTTLITATIGSVSASCAVTVGAQATAPVATEVQADGAKLSFPQVTGASYYLVHLYAVSGAGFTPVFTLKVTPDGQVSLRAAAGHTLIVPLTYLAPATAYVARIETIRTTNGKAEVIQTDVVSFKTSGTTGIDEATTATPRVHYAAGTLYLINLEGYDCTLFSLSGQRLQSYRVTSPEEARSIALPRGVYMLSYLSPDLSPQGRGVERKVFKFVVF
jgi:uncharacterized protein YjdB